MPGLTGLELCQRLKRESQTKHIPIILMSAAGNKAADLAGADAFIAKPFDIEDMEELILRFVGS